MTAIKLKGEGQEHVSSCSRTQHLDPGPSSPGVQPVLQLPQDAGDVRFYLFFKVTDNGLYSAQLRMNLRKIIFDSRQLANKRGTSPFYRYIYPWAPAISHVA